jgi:hypothetical protein
MSLEKQAGRLRTLFNTEEEANSYQALIDSLSPEELELLLAYERGDAQAVSQVEALERQTFRHRPIPIEDWLEDPYYCGPDGAMLYPRLKRAICDIVRGNFVEVICTGSVGWGKSTLACMLARYMLYYLTCFQDPALAHGLGPNGIVTLALFSTRLKQTKATTWKKLKTGVENTPYFRENCKSIRWPNTGNEAMIDGRIQILAAPTDDNAAIGTDLFFAIMDEVNFGRNAVMTEEKGSVNQSSTLMTVGERIYLSIVKRIASRFDYRGHCSGKVVVISSKNDESDLTEKRVLAAKHQKGIYVADYLAHEIRPKGTTSGKMMRVFFGGAYRKSRILEDHEEDPEEAEDAAGAMVIHLPEEMRSAFETDMIGALRSLAGVSVPNFHHYFHDPIKIRSVFEGRQDVHPFHGDEWICGDPHNVRWDLICDGFYERMGPGQYEKVYRPKVNPNAVRHVHLDLSKKRDSTGLAIGHIAQMVEVPFYDVDSGQVIKEIKPFIWTDFVLAINAPTGGVIDYDMIRELLYAFKNHGFKIGHLTADSYQSHDLITTIRKRLCHAEELSIDRTMKPYDVFRAAVHQGRVSCYEYARLEREMSRLLYDAKRLKVDHPPNQGAQDQKVIESKDVSDAMAGMVFSLTELRASSQALIPPEAVMAMQRAGAATSPLDVFIDAKTGKPAPKEHNSGAAWWSVNGALPFIKG